MKKFLVDIEFRYNDAPDSCGGTYKSKTVTIGVYDTAEEAYSAGNAALMGLEKRFPLNKNWNRKERFSKNGGCFGYPKHLITESAYLITPFSFFAQVTPLDIAPVMPAVDDVLQSIERYKTHKEED